MTALEISGDGELAPAELAPDEVAAEPLPDEPLPAEQPGVLWETLNGNTSCTLPGGTASSTVLTTKCFSNCTSQHEALHVADIKPCCAKAGAATPRRRTTTPGRPSRRRLKLDAGERGLPGVPGLREERQLR